MTRALPLALLLALTGCATERVRDLPVVDSSELTLVVEEEGPWTDVTPSDPSAPPVARAEPPAPAPPVDPPAPVLPVPARRTAEPPRGVAPGRSLEGLARERYLSHPTLVRAARITFRCPSAYAPEVQAAGERSREEGPGRRVLEGGARLLCRELTLEADTIVLQVREGADADLQIAARGSVSFVSEQRGQVFREEGVRSLLVTNDRVVPLR